MNVWRRLWVAGSAAFASFVLAGALVEIALAGPGRRHVGRLPFATGDPALAAAGLLALLGVGVLLRGVGRR